MWDKILLYNLRQQVVLYASLPVRHKDMDSYEDKDVVDAYCINSAPFYIFGNQVVPTG